MSGRREYTNEFPAPQLPERRGNFVEPFPPVRRPATVDAVRDRVGQFLGRRTG